MQVKTDNLKNTTIDLIRHGEPEGGTRFRGWKNDPLSAKGWQQMRQATAGHTPWDLIITSPLVRCSAFAEELSERTGIPVVKEDRLKEIGFGQWEGRTSDELYAESPEVLNHFWRSPAENPPPGGEPMVLFQSRVESAWQDIQIHNEGRHILVVAHGGVNRFIIGKVLGIPIRNLFRMEYPFAGISRIRVEEGYARLVFHCGLLG